MREVFFTVNGPGEAAGWLKPLAADLRAADPDIRLSVLLMPCVFSSGAEKTAIEDFGTVDRVFSVSETIRLALRGHEPGTDPRLLFHLGGEVALSHVLAWRLGCPIWGYCETEPLWSRRFGEIYFNDLNPLPRGYENQEHRRVGELMVDAATAARAAVAKTSGAPMTVAIYPGSRPIFVQHALPYLARMIDLASARRSDLRWIMARAPFIDEAVLKAVSRPIGNRPYSFSNVTYRHSSGTIETEGGVSIRVCGDDEALSLCDFAVAVPGTSTGKLAASGIPMVVFLATQVSEVIPLPGIGGHLGHIPLIGSALKRWIGGRLLARLPLLAQPNRRAGRMIVPELVGKVEQSELVGALFDLIDRDGPDLRQAVSSAMGRPGAARRLTSAILGSMHQAAQV